MLQLEHFEDALEYLGWGIYSKFLVVVAVICYFTQGAAWVSISFAVPLTTCEIPFNKNDLLLMNIVFHMGKAIGGYLLNSASDSFGRDVFLSNGMILICGSTFLGAFSHGIYFICLAAFVLGSGLELSAVTAKVHFAELMPLRKRAICMAFMDLMWTFGYIFTSLLSFGVTKFAVFKHNGMDMKLSSWRIIFSVSGGLNLIGAVFVALLEGSPRFLLTRRRPDLAIPILRKMYSINRSKDVQSFEIKPADLEKLIKTCGLNNPPLHAQCCDHVRFFLKNMCRTTKLLLQKRYHRVLLALILIRLSMIFGLHGVNNWLARMLHINNENCTLSTIDLLHLQEMKPYNNNCSISLDRMLYLNYFLITASILSGRIIAAVFVNRVGRRISIFTGLFICGISCFALGSMPKLYVFKLVFSSITMASFSCTDTILSIVCVEAFPTCLRGTANAQVRFFPHFVLCVLYAYLDTTCQNFFIIMGSLTMGASLISYFIPEMQKRPMVE